MFKYTKTTLKKVEEILEDSGYTIRYEKGNFQSGYCLVESQQVAVVNKFFDTEARINTLIEIVLKNDIEPEQLSEKARKFHRMILKEHENN